MTAAEWPQRRGVEAMVDQVHILRAAIALMSLGLAEQGHCFTLDVSEAHKYFERNHEARGFLPFLDGNVPLHEMMTDQSLECTVPGSVCERLAAIGISAKAIREGVRSNDFPAQYLTENAVPWCKNRVLRMTQDGDVACILGSFVKAANSKEKFAEKAWALARPFGMRGHFGDLQFLHAMASQGQPAGKTFDGIRMWMEFAYRASRDEFDLKADVHGLPIAGLKDHFVRGSRKVGDLLNYRFSKEVARGVALGQMLHIAQDSFAGCHTERDKDGSIVRFLSYEMQSSSRHAQFDKDRAKADEVLGRPMNPVAFGKELLALRAANKEWAEVEPLIRRYFSPVKETEPAVAGADCR